MSLRLRCPVVLACCVALLLAAVPLRATETEHTLYRLLPAPGKVVVDGKFDDWDLSGSLFICSDVENFRDQFASWQSAMYDADNLYLLSRWTDTTPMNNPGLCGSDMGFQGDCLQVRFIIGHEGKPQGMGDDKALNQRITHLTAWSGRDGTNLIDVAYGRQFNEGGLKDAKAVGAQQAFAKTPDGKGYVQEIAIPWKVLTIDGKAPKAGDHVIMTYEPNFSTDSKMRVSTKDLFRAGVTPDRVFAFAAYDRWGLAEIAAAGKVACAPVRLADGRTFPVTLVAGLPTVDWNGLYKAETHEGFAKVHFDLPADGFASLIIKDASGQVVRQLLTAEFLTKGSHDLLWDGLTTPSDRQPGDPVPAGTYTWEGIWHTGINLKLTGWASNSGRTPYDSPGGNWGGDMGCPVAVASDATHVYLGWGASEAGKALVCTDFNGNVQWRHKRGGFGGAALVAVTKGSVYVYDAGQDNAVYRLDAAKGEYVNWQGATEAILLVTPLLTAYKPAEVKDTPMVSGMTASGDKLYLSYGTRNNSPSPTAPVGNVLLVLDAQTGKEFAHLAVPNPGMLATGADGKVYAVTHGGTQVAVLDAAGAALTPVLTGLTNAASATADKDGNVYVGLGVPDNQVKVYSPAGKPLRSIGLAGGRPHTGPWQHDGMVAINGIGIDPQGQLWVTEGMDHPKRVVVWQAATGVFAREFFGPTHYGAGGGAILPTDPSYVVGEGCEWHLSPDTGKADCVGTIAETCWANARFGMGNGGRVYLATCNDNWSNQPVSIYERLAPGQWRLRTIISTADEKGQVNHVTVWSDRNDDQQRQPDEVHEFTLPMIGWIDGWYMPCNQALTFAGGAYRFEVTGWTPCGAPEYDLAKALKLPGPTDGNQRGGMSARWNLVSEDGNYVIWNAGYGLEHSDSPCYDIRTGKLVFAYPNCYTGVHGGHLAPPAKLGLIRAAYDFVGTAKLPAPIDNLFCIGTDKGEWHLLSSSGYYLTHLFEGDTMRMKWPEEAVPGANMNTVPPGMGAEDFGGSMIRTTDGRVFIQAGKCAFVVSQVTGLETVKELGKGTLTIAPTDLPLAQGFKVKYLAVATNEHHADAARKTVAFTGDPAKDFGSKPLQYGPDGARVSTWLAHDDTTFYAAWAVQDATPWINGATGYENLYATGDTVDLQLATDPSADPKRREAVAGDLRLSIGRWQGKDTAVLYRKVSTEAAPKTFYSGTCQGGYTMAFAKVIESAKIVSTVNAGKGYLVEVAIPLATLGVALTPGLKLRGDVGITCSDLEGKDTNLRVYWSNQAAGIVADEVEELKMQPSMWGDFTLE